MNDWRTYDGVAETYERILAPRFLDVARDLVAQAEIGPGMTVLDVGAGTGVVSQASREAGASTIASDPSLEMLTVGRATRDFTAVAATAIDLPFRSERFDAALGNFVLAHFSSAETALHDILRVVKTGGTVGFSSWAASPTDAFQETWSQLIESVIPREVLKPAYEQAAPGHDRFRKRDLLEATLIDAGLRHVKTEVRKYRWVYDRDEYVESLGVWIVGRFAREMLGASGWESLMKRAKETFAERFPDPLNDFSDVLLVTGVKK